MDHAQILLTLQNAIPMGIWYLILLLILTVVIKSSWCKGKVGETVVYLSARLFLDNTRYHLIKNITLPTKDGATQTDHIIASRYGVFVVETNKIEGWIFSGEKQRYWTRLVCKC
tara:strand:+ start:513 stop:854 length:342 start_codon:yes stop_codon:yes gene_type:complete